MKTPAEIFRRKAFTDFNVNIQREVCLSDYLFLFNLKVNKYVLEVASSLLHASFEPESCTFMYIFLMKNKVIDIVSVPIHSVVTLNVLLPTFAHNDNTKDDKNYP